MASQKRIISTGDISGRVDGQLSERLKELHCLHELARILLNDHSEEELLTEAVALLSPAWRYPEITRARITLEQRHYPTEPIEKTTWALSSDLLVSGDVLGTVEVYYVERRPALDEGPFLAEERELLDSFAGILAGGIQNKRSQESLRKANDRLSAAHARLEMALRAGNVGLWDRDLTSGAHFCSPEWKSQIGYGADELEEDLEIWLDRLHRDDRERLMEKTRAVLDGTVTSFSDDFRLQHKDGSFRWIHSVGEAIRDASGKPTRLIGCHLDITDRRSAEGERAAILELSTDLICVLGLDGSFKYVSPSFERTLGHKAEALLPRPFLEFVHSDDHDNTNAAVARLTAGEEIRNFENQCLHEDGSVRIISWNATLLSEAGQMYCIGRDVTQERLAQRDADLRARIGEILLSTPDEKMYSDVLEVVLSGLESEFGIFGYIDQDGSFVVPSMTRPVWDRRRVSEKAVVFPRETWGQGAWPRAIRQKKTLCSNRPSSDIPQAHLPITRNLVAPIIHRDQVIGLIHVANKAADYTPEDIERLESICRRLAPVLSARLETDQKEQELRKSANELRESADKTAAIVEHIGVGVALINPKMQIVEANSQFRRYFRDLDISSQPICFEVCNEPPKDKPCSDCPVFRTLDDGRPHEATHFKSRGEETRTYRAISSAVRNSEGKVVGAIEVIDDITEKLQAEERIEQAHRLEALGTLAGGIAHDFNNLLYVMLVNADLVKEHTPQGSEAYDCLVQLAEAGERAGSLVKQILDFSRKGRQRARVVKIQEEAETTMAFLRETLPSTIEIRQELDPDCGAISADPTDIHQVIMNSCTNASHAMRDAGGVLTIRLEEQEVGRGMAGSIEGIKSKRYACLTVSDTGHGMDDRTRARALEPFFTTKGVGEGTGMGLATVHGIVTRLEGRITLESTPRIGTTVAVYLPLSAGKEVAAVEDEPGLDETLPTGSESILYVDDEEAITRLASTSLKALGYTVTTFSDSLKALDAFRSGPDEFDLVLTDQTMPNLTGVELAEEMLRIRPSIPIILCTGYFEAASQRQAENLRIRASLQKPISRKALAQAIRAALGARTSEVR